MDRSVSQRVGTVAARVFILLAAFLAVTWVYEWAAYRGYLSLYRRNGIRLVGRMTVEALSRPGSEAERMERLAGIAREAMKDPSVADVWFTDGDYRLLYSADRDLYREFGGRRLPARFYPLYEAGFAPTGGEFRPVEKGGIERGFVHVVLPLRLTGSGLFDMTVGMKLRSVSFLAVQDPLLVTSWFAFHPGVAAAWLGMLLLALLAAWRVGWLAAGLYGEALGMVDRFIGTIGSPAGVKVSASKAMAPLAERLGELARRYDQSVREAVLEAGRKAEEGCEAAAKRAVVTVLMPRPSGVLAGLAYAGLYPEGAADAEVLVTVREWEGFRSMFLAARCGETKAAGVVASAGLLRAAVERMATGMEPRESLLRLNREFRSAGLEAMPVGGGLFGLADGVLTVFLAGWSGVLYHRGRSGEGVVFPGSGAAVGSRPDEDFVAAYREEKVRLESGDAVLLFDGRFLESVGIAGMKESLAGAKSVEDVLGLFREKGGAGFCLAVRKT